MKALFAAALVLVAACGEGRAIFNIDAYSFMAGTGKDTIPYVIPPATSATASTVQKINLPPGFGSSGIDSVRITTGGADLINTAGTGTIGFQLFFASDSAQSCCGRSFGISGMGGSSATTSRRRFISRISDLAG